MLTPWKESYDQPRQHIKKHITLPTKIHLVKAMVFPVVMCGCESWTIKKLSTKELMLLNCGVGEDCCESLGLQGDPTSPSPSPTPGVDSNSCPLHQWCHPTISSPVIPFSSHLQSSPPSGSFPMSQLFASGGLSIGVSASASALTMYSPRVAVIAFDLPSLGPSPSLNQLLWPGRCLFSLARLGS